MPSTYDLVTFAELVQLGRDQAEQEWKRRGGKLAACAGAELLGAALSHTERSCLRYGYREQLHTLNCRAELGPIAPATLIVGRTVGQLAAELHEFTERSAALRERLQLPPARTGRRS